MGRSPCCSKEGMNRGAWNAHEDRILTDYIKTHGEGGWRNLPKTAGLKRCGKSCRLRWLNYLRPGIKRGNISSDEEELIIRLHNLLGNRWSLIAGRLPGRTDNEIKNYWNTNLCKRFKKPLTIAPDNSEKSPSHHHKKTESSVVRTKASKCTNLLFKDAADTDGFYYDSNDVNDFADFGMDLRNLDSDCFNLFDKSPPSICNEAGQGIVLSSEDLEFMEDWIANGD